MDISLAISEYVLAILTCVPRLTDLTEDMLIVTGANHFPVNALGTATRHSSLPEDTSTRPRMTFVGGQRNAGVNVLGAYFSRYEYFVGRLALFPEARAFETPGILNGNPCIKRIIRLCSRYVKWIDSTIISSDVRLRLQK